MKTVLAVDDSATVRETLRMTLEEAGYEVVLACDGVEAVDKLDPDLVDMVVTDLNMPKMDGLELIRKVRGTPGFRFTPILMLTSEIQEGLKREGKKAGASCWLNKPFSPDQLLSVIRMILPI